MSFFNDDANKYHKTINVGSVYVISNGRIKTNNKQ